MGRPTLEERFWAKVDRRGSDDCWPWLAATSNGYGAFRLEGNARHAHGVAYELLVGPIPDGLQLDHLCHSRDTKCGGGKSCPHRACVNPAHLEPVTNRENTARGLAGVVSAARMRARTHCARNHPFNKANTYIDSRGHRRCRICRREATRRWEARRSAA